MARRVYDDQTRRLERNLAKARLRLDSAWVELKAAELAHIDARSALTEHEEMRDDD
jgi:hypothetical protein